jgi:hypothetical protein
MWRIYYLLSKSTNCPQCMEPECLFRCSEHSATGRSSEPNKSIPHTAMLISLRICRTYLLLLNVCFISAWNGEQFAIEVSAYSETLLFPHASTALVDLGLLCEFPPSQWHTPHLVGLLGTSRRRDLYLTTLTRDRHPILRPDSNPQSQQASGRKTTP